MKVLKIFVTVATVAVIAILIGFPIFVVAFDRPVAAATEETTDPATPDPRPVPPYVQTWAIPPGSPELDGMVPAACSDAPGSCGILCFYDANAPVEDGRALSCVPVVFSSDK